MKPYLLSSVCGRNESAQILHQLALAEDFMQRLPESESEERWSCHVLVRAFNRIFGEEFTWKVQDGHFGRYGTCHSWLWSSDSDIFLDLYPVAGINPFIVACKQSPWNALYMEHTRDYDRIIREVWEDHVLEAIQLWAKANERQYDSS